MVCASPAQILAEVRATFLSDWVTPSTYNLGSPGTAITTCDQLAGLHQQRCECEADLYKEYPVNIYNEATKQGWAVHQCVGLKWLYQNVNCCNGAPVNLLYQLR